MHYRVRLQDVFDAHAQALAFGGRSGILNVGSVESAIARPYSGYHRPMSRKCAALMHALIRNHGFVDGNKRTALIVTLLLIERSGYRLALQSSERIDDMVVAEADGAMDYEELVVWFRQRLRRRT